MKEDLHNIDELFKSSIEEHEEMPSPGVWDAIDKNLDNDKVIDITKRYLTVRKVAIVLLVLLATIGFYEITTWNTGDKIVKRIKAKKGNTNGLPDNNSNNTVYEKPSTLKRTVDPSHSLNGGQAYTETNNAGQNNLNEDPGSLLNNSGEVRAAIPKEKTVQDAIQQTIPFANVSKTKNKTFATLAHANHTTPGLVVKEINKNNQMVAEPGFKQKITSANSDIAPAFTALVQITAPISIDLYGSFSLPALNKLSHLLTADTKSNTPIKLIVKNRSRFATTIFVSRDFVSNRLIMDRVGNHERDREEIKRTESASSAFTTGVLAEYAINKNWSLLSGINISKTTIHIEPKIIYARPDDFGNVKFRFNCSAGYSFLSLKTGMPPANGDSLRALESSNIMQYIGIPLAIKYNFTKQKFRFNAMAGISANILINQKIQTVIANGSNNERSVLDDINGLKKSYFSGLLGLGIDYSVTKNIALSFIPNARLALTSINKDAPVKSYPQSFGLGAGIRLRL